VRVRFPRGAGIGSYICSSLAAVASEHHRARTKGRTVAIEQFRNSNAYAVPGDIAAQSDLSAYAESAMTSGTAGH